MKHDARARQVDAIARMPYSLPCSAFQNLNMDGLLERMWTSMALVRVYTKRARPWAAAAAAVAPGTCAGRHAMFCTGLRARALHVHAIPAHAQKDRCFPDPNSDPSVAGGR